MRTPMMLLAFTSCSSLSRTTSQGNLFAVCTMSAAGRACSPILLRTVQTFSACSSATRDPFPNWLEEAASQGKAEGQRHVQRHRQPHAREEEDARDDHRRNQDAVPRAVRLRREQDPAGGQRAGEDRGAHLQPPRCRRDVRPRKNLDDRRTLLIPGREEPDAHREVDRIVDGEEERDTVEARVRPRQSGQERRGWPEREPEEAVAERRERRGEGRLEARYVLRTGGAARDLFLETYGTADYGRRGVGMAVEQLEVSAGRGAAGLFVRIEIGERRRHRGGESQVLHAARVPSGLDEQRPEEDPQEGSFRHVTRHPGHGHPERRRPRTSVAAKAARANTGARRSRTARIAVAAASAQTACQEPVSAETARGEQLDRRTARIGEKKATAKQIAAVATKGRTSPRRLIGNGSGSSAAFAKASSNRALLRSSVRRSRRRPTRASGKSKSSASAARGGSTPVPVALPARTAAVVIAPASSVSLSGKEPPRFTPPRKRSSSGTPMTRPPCASPSAHPRSGPSTRGRLSINCSAPLRSTAATPATSAATAPATNKWATPPGGNTARHASRARRYSATSAAPRRESARRSPAASRASRRAPLAPRSRSPSR